MDKLKEYYNIFYAGANKEYVNKKLYISIPIALLAIMSASTSNILAIVFAVVFYGGNAIFYPYSSYVHDNTIGKYFGGFKTPKRVVRFREDSYYVRTDSGVERVDIERDRKLTFEKWAEKAFLVWSLQLMYIFIKFGVFYMLAIPIGGLGYLSFRNKNKNISQVQ